VMIASRSPSTALTMSPARTCYFSPLVNCTIAETSGIWSSDASCLNSMVTAARTPSGNNLRIFRLLGT
jgi:hypothetical protein